MSCIHILLSPAFLVAEIMVWNADIIDIVLTICGLRKSKQLSLDIFVILLHLYL